jgi:two-component system, LytTR family, sensor kinase
MLLVLSAAAIHVFVLHRVFYFDWGVTFADAICGNVFLFLSVWSLVLLVKAYPTSAAIFPYALCMAFILSVTVTTTEYELLKWWVTDDEYQYKFWLKHTLMVRFIITWLFSSWMASNAALRKNISALESRFQQQADASVLLREAELFKLRQQLQPHFLYNSLNSISALIMITPAKAQEMIGKLSDFLRSSVKRESEDTLPVNDELNYIQSYLAIESVRFGDRLQVHIEKEYTDDATIPPFLLQPILENAIKFGLYGKTGDVGVTIHIVLEGQMLVITVTNPFDADTQPPKGTGFGLEGIRRRLYLLYARSDLLETQRDEHNFTTILKIPQRHV